MANPSKKMSPVGRVKNHSKAGKFLPKKPLKDGMSSSKADAKMSKLQPGDARPSYKAGKVIADGSNPTMVPATKNKKARKKSKQGNPFGGK